MALALLTNVGAVPPFQLIEAGHVIVLAVLVSSFVLTIYTFPFAVLAKDTVVLAL